MFVTLKAKVFELKIMCSLTVCTHEKFAFFKYHFWKNKLIGYFVRFIRFM